MKKALRILCDLILAATVFTVLLFFVLQICGYQLYTVVSGSMEPKVSVGSVCLIDTKVPYKEIKAGDVIAFSQGDFKVTHRVKAVTEKGLETKGDANAHSDGITTTKKNYIGKNVGSMPYLGYGLKYLQTDQGRIVALTVLVALFLVSVLADQKSDQKIKEKEELL